ncbi:hypothetical protein EDE12_106177 [Methylosinus sp. sav-2]|nr:hypothetical protein EDE12_106177 [Methylosinus sp. sav-2]
MTHMVEEQLHPETHAMLDRFAEALKEKARASEIKHGFTDDWRRNDWEAQCKADLLRHVAKGDPKDVAIYAAFCWARGWTTIPAHLIDSRYALIYSDGSFGILSAGASLEKAREEAAFADQNETDPRHLTKVGRVSLIILEDFGTIASAAEQKCPSCGREPKAAE